MGASIVYGLMSFDGNGFRLGLQDLLLANGTRTTMVGTQWSGNMSDNHHEAYQGLMVNDFNNVSYHSGAYDMGANVVLVHIGTNDCWWVKGETGEGAATRIGYLLDSIREKLPDALVLASTLIYNTNNKTDLCIQGINSHLPAVVQSAVEKGQQVKLVDMYPVVPHDQMAEDGTHPTDYGYQLMAHQWYDSIVNATKESCVEQKAADTTATVPATSPGTSTPEIPAGSSGNTSSQSIAATAGAGVVSTHLATQLLVPIAMSALIFYL